MNGHISSDTVRHLPSAFLARVDATDGHASARPQAYLPALMLATALALTFGPPVLGFGAAVGTGVLWCRWLDHCDDGDR